MMSDNSKQSSKDLKEKHHKKYSPTQYNFQFGPKNYVVPKTYTDFADKYYNFELRKDDIFLLGFPRSGTTLSQEIIWLLNNNLDFEKAKSTLITERFPYFELELFASALYKDASDAQKTVIEEMKVPLKTLPTAKSPRFIKSHMPLSLLPSNLLDTAKVVYVFRDPRDVAVSNYNFERSIFHYEDFKQFWEMFKDGLIRWTPFFEHVKEAWARRNHPNMLFYTYEELTADTLGTVRRIAQFCGRRYSEPQLAALCDHLRFDNFRNNPAVNKDTTLKALGITKDGEQSFIRRGKAGGWQDYFDEEMQADAERWMATQLEGTDLPFTCTKT